MKAIVIGSGMAGLTAAAYLAQAGNDVTVYEQFESIGGVTASLNQNGFRWDLGPLLMEKFEPGEAAHDVLKELQIEGRIKTVMDDGGMAFPDFALWKQREYGGPYWRRDALKALFPEEAAGLDAYYAFYDTMVKLSFYMRNPDGRGKGLLDKAKAFAAWCRVKKMSGWSAAQVTEHFFKNPRLRAVFTGILADFCVTPGEFAGLGVPLVNLETAFDKRIPLESKGIKKPGYCYIAGGMGKLVEAVAERIASCGGRIHTGAAVEKILVENGRAAGVALAGGETDKADYILASGGAKETFYNLVGKEHLTDYYIQAIEAFWPMDSVFMVHLGVDYDPLRFQRAALCYYYNTYDIETGVLRCRNGVYHEGNDGFLIYVPSAHSPEMAPKGCHAVTIYTIAPNVLADGAWQDKKEVYAATLIEKAEAHLPGLRRHIVEKAVLAPPDFQRRTHLAHHAFGGIAPIMGKQKPPHETPVEGLYFIGAQSESGGGVAGVMSGARKVIRKILKL